MPGDDGDELGIGWGPKAFSNRDLQFLKVFPCFFKEFREKMSFFMIFIEKK